MSYADIVKGVEPTQPKRTIQVSKINITEDKIEQVPQVIHSEWYPPSSPMNAYIRYGDDGERFYVKPALGKYEYTLNIVSGREKPVPISRIHPEDRMRFITELSFTPYTPTLCDMFQKDFNMSIFMSLKEENFREKDINDDESLLHLICNRTFTNDMMWKVFEENPSLFKMTNKEGDTPLHYIFSNLNNSEDVLLELIKLPKDYFFQKNMFGYTVYDHIQYINRPFSDKLIKAFDSIHKN